MDNCSSTPSSCVVVYYCMQHLQYNFTQATQNHEDIGTSTTALKTLQATLPPHTISGLIDGMKLEDFSPNFQTFLIVP